MWKYILPIYAGTSAQAWRVGIFSYPAPFGSTILELATVNIRLSPTPIRTLIASPSRTQTTVNDGMEREFSAGA